jgi:alpha-acetolactate decarboxylase
MLPFFDMTQEILGQPLTDINADKINYNEVILFELDNLTKQSTISQSKNQYNVFINLYYITRASDEEHTKKALKILGKFESHRARVIQKMTCSQLVIINASNYLVSHYELCFSHNF